MPALGRSDSRLLRLEVHSLQELGAALVVGHHKLGKRLRRLASRLDAKRIEPAFVLSAR